MTCSLCGQEYYNFAHFYECTQDPRRRIDQDYNVLLLTEADKQLLRDMGIKWP